MRFDQSANITTPRNERRLMDKVFYTKMKKWQPFPKSWINTALTIGYFTKIRWIFISIQNRCGLVVSWEEKTSGHVSVSALVPRTFWDPRFFSHQPVFFLHQVIQRLIRSLAVVFIHPKLCYFPYVIQCSERRGKVSPPGQNEKYYLASALHNNTEKDSYEGSRRKKLSLFISCFNTWKRRTDGQKRSLLSWITTLFTRVREHETGWKRILILTLLICRFTHHGWIMLSGHGKHCTIR